jgi:hypothetical protein
MLLSCTQQLTINLSTGHTAPAHNSSIITAPVDLQHIFLSTHAGNASCYLYLH